MSLWFFRERVFCGHFLCIPRILCLLCQYSWLVFLPPANEVCEGYVFTPVCQSFCSQEGCLPQCMLGYTHPHPLGADTPPGADTPGNRHTPGADTPPCTVHAGRYEQQAGGTHPTGMHTCYIDFWRQNFTVILGLACRWNPSLYILIRPCVFDIW